MRLGCLEGDYRLVCECGLSGCAQAIVVPAGVFGELRRTHEFHSIVAPGHAGGPAEFPVVTAATFEIVTRTDALSAA